MHLDVAFPNLGIEIQTLPRTILGGNVYMYGVAIFIGVLAGLAYGVHEAKRTGQDPDLYFNFLFYALIASVIGARLYYVAFSWDNFRDDWLRIFAIREGGLAIYGTIFAAIATALVYTRKHRINFRLFADTASPGLILGQAIGRWGNFFNREVFGVDTDSLFAMRYLAEQVGYIPQQVTTFMIDGASYIQVHPTFLYEGLWSLSVFTFMNICKKRKKFDGQIFAIYLIGYGTGRAIIEQIRTDILFLWNTNLAVSQLVSIALVAVGIGLVFIWRKER